MAVRSGSSEELAAGSGRDGFGFGGGRRVRSPSPRWRTPCPRGVDGDRRRRLCSLRGERGPWGQPLAWGSLGVSVRSPRCSLWAWLARDAFALLLAVPGPGGERFPGPWGMLPRRLRCHCCWRATLTSGAESRAGSADLFSASVCSTGSLSPRRVVRLLCYAPYALFVLLSLRCPFPASARGRAWEIKPSEISVCPFLVS